MSERTDRLAGQVEARGLDALLVTRLANVRYLAGFTGSSAALLVGPGRLTFLTDGRYVTQAREQVPDEFEVVVFEHDLLASVAAALAGEGTVHVGFDAGHLPVSVHARLQELVGERVRLAPAAGMVEELRAVKDEGEIQRLRAAAELADEALRQVLDQGLVGRTEREVALELEMAMRRMGAEAVSFPPIVAAGAHAALPHATPRDAEIPAGALVVIDWGAKLEGYCSDCTRTLATGEVDGRADEVYALVLEAQTEALAAVLPGRSGREVDAVARDLIIIAGHEEHFRHGLGHGVGLDVHEAPRLSSASTARLAPGHVVTVEPGVYVPDEVGVRIEDLVVVRDDAPEVLSGLPKTLTIVE